jgi:hypothetical protein
LEFCILELGFYSSWLFCASTLDCASLLACRSISQL